MWHKLLLLLYMKLEEMNEILLQNEIQTFIRSYEGSLTDLALKGNPFPEISIQDLIQQVEGFRKCKKKLPSWYNAAGIFYPPKLNIEQTSSEITAKYKASLVSGKTMLDLTGGLGIDSFYFATKMEEVFHFEINTVLSKIAAHNFNILGVNNVITKNENGLDTLETSSADIIYLDPARRDTKNQKVFQLEAYTPNILEHLSKLFETAPIVLLKTAPLLDISDGIGKLKSVSEVHIVAVNNEVKELLWILKKRISTAPTIVAVNIMEGKTTNFSFDWQTNSNSIISLPKKYLYEPNAALLKSGAFSLIGERFGVSKLAIHSHLYTSEKIIENFQGRIFRIIAYYPYSKKYVRLFSKANITTRNFPESVVAIRKKYKIKDGGDQYLFFTTLQNNEKVVIVSEKHTY